MVEEKERLRRYVRILQVLAETENQLNMYGIWRKLKDTGFGSEPTIIYAIKDLEKWDMVKLVKTRKVRPGKHRFNYYELTQTGIENLISAGILRMQSISLDKVRLLLGKYRELLPYASEIFDLWPAFEDARVEDIAMRRLALFIAYSHGETLVHYLHYGVGASILGWHALASWRPTDSATEADSFPLTCTADDDVEAFADLQPKFYSLEQPYRYEKDMMDKEIGRWLLFVRSNEKLQAIVLRAALKEAEARLASAEDTLNLLEVESVHLKGSGEETYKKLVAKVDFLSSKIVTQTS